MAKYYRFGEPSIGCVHSAFRTLKGLKDFIKIAGMLEGHNVSFYEISGKMVEDNGGMDGLEVLVTSYQKLF
ncbi:MAG: hypothetical protein U9Q69_03665 [Nanoarchaeota archaeon]|nr:hypothetical protein [Nanoarchaeota archaeon]